MCSCVSVNLIFHEISDFFCWAELRIRALERQRFVSFFRTFSLEREVKSLLKPSFSPTLQSTDTHKSFADVLRMKLVGSAAMKPQAFMGCGAGV